MPINSIILDLDDTLYDCTGSLVELARRKAAQAMVEAGVPCSAEDAYRLQVELSEKYGPYYLVFDAIAKRYGMGASMVEKALHAYNSDEVPPIHPFPLVVPTLRQLRAEDYRLILLTTGIHRRQQRKIELLGLRDYFDEVIINDQERGVPLADCFRGILNRYHLTPRQVACVGDRVRDEIRVGNDLGMTTVQMIHGRFAHETGPNGLERPQYKIKRIYQLPTILGLANLGKGPDKLRVLAVGGGTGLPMVLEGAKTYSRNLTAVVTVTDSGRSSGKLREEYGVLPPGDARNCLVALSESEDRERDLYDLFQYRFKGGSLDGMSLGNLLMTALADMTGSFERAIAKASKILAIRGKVLPSTLEDTHICAELEDGSIIEEELNVRRPGKSPIKRVFLQSDTAEASPDVIEEIERADLIVLGPGSLYTSVISNLLVRGIPEAIRRSKAKKVYVCNIVTQPGQTDGYTAADHVKAITRYLGDGILDCAIVNRHVPKEEVMKRYRSESAEIASVTSALDALGVPVREADLVEDLDQGRVLWEKQDLLRHDPDKLGDAICRFYAGVSPLETYGQ
ncbi:MAG: uridine diphosphate-N-acetylglucosamine-binding protein YvcK [Planctomycetes bacterium]|nr:uridine diphosphate-N-acetylglucosamine-binding protein YvcK [Planctomycetota bacterium]